jgi:hypothetical protein
MSNEVRLRARFPAGGNLFDRLSIITDKQDLNSSDDALPAREWSVTDDVLNVSDSACFTVANEDGRNTGKFHLGQRVELDESDPDVANGQWVRHFTGRVTAIRTYTDVQGGSNIMVTCMDLGWHLTSSSAAMFQKNAKGKPVRVQLRNKTFRQLIDAVVDTSWGFGKVVFDGDENARLKHGRQVIVQNLNPQLGAILPFIQVEIGQTPYDLLSLYAAREGLLINVGARGELIFFRPNYKNQAIYEVHLHPSTSASRTKNNVVGAPSLSETIDGIYSQTQCWSTVVIPPAIQNTENPNEQYRHSEFTPSENPLPFARHLTFSDQEGINQTLRENRAKWKWQMGSFEAFLYEVELQGHSQNGGFFVSNTMVSVDDEINGLQGAYYIQSVRRSLTLRDGLKTQLKIRRPGLLDPTLNGLPSTNKRLGGGSKKAAKMPASVP